MKKFTALSLVCALVAIVYAYDYQTVVSNRVALYQSSKGHIDGMKIDSVVINGDTILYPMKNIQPVEDYCIDQNGPSWLGEKIIISPEWNYFFNVQGDTIKIKTNAGFHESWMLFEDEEVSITAIVYFHDTMTVLGLVDSVKTIELQAYYKSYPTNNFAHGILLLSKHFGLIFTYNMYLFPYNQQDNSSSRLEEFDLVGIDNSDYGIQNLKWFDVFDFQPGDEFHTEKIDLTTTDGPPTKRIIKNIREIKNRENFTDSIVYQIQEKNERTHTYGQDLMGYELTDKSVRLVIKQNPEFDLLPGQPYVKNSDLLSNYMTSQNNIPCKGENEPIEFNNNLSCWSYMLDYYSDVCYTDNSLYHKGLGGPYYDNVSGCWEIDKSYESRTLMYYKKGDVVWGTPIILSALDELTFDAGIVVYRNPTKDVLCIKFSNPVEQSFIKIYDLAGALLHNEEILTAESEIDLKTFHRGVYVYQLSVYGQTVKSGKFVR